MNRLKYSRLFSVILLILVAFGLRTVGSGYAPFQGDEVWNGFLAFQFGSLGERSPLGVVSSTGLNQAPFLADVFALPFFISPDPRIARLFMAMLQIVGLAVIFRLGTGYWSFAVGITMLAIMATMPRAVWAGRFLWNPYLTLPFLATYILSGFALSENRTWGKLVHPPALALAIQAHPSAVAFLPVSILFYGRWLFRGKTTHLKHDLLIHIMGIGLAVLAMSPWILGILTTAARTELGQADLGWKLGSTLDRIIQHLLPLTTKLDTGAFGIPNEDWNHPAGLPAIQSALNFGVMIGAGILILRGVYRKRFRDFAAGLCFWLFPLTLSIMPSNVYNFYLSLLLPSAGIVWAVLLMGPPARHRIMGWARVVAVIAIVALQLYISVDGILQLASFSHFTRESTLPLQDMIALRNELGSLDGDPIFVVEGASGDDFEQALLWHIISGRNRYRVIWGNTRTVPVPIGGTTYVDYEGAPNLPEILGDRARYRTYRDIYRVITLPPNSALYPSCEAVEPSRFGIGNGARIIGYSTEQEGRPTSGEEWKLFILWEGQQHPETTVYQMAVHLIDEAGDKYAQADVTTLSPSVWRDTEQLVTPVTLTASDALPTDEPLFLRIIFYTLPDMNTANSVDADGNVVAPWVIMPLCDAPPTAESAYRPGPSAVRS